MNNESFDDFLERLRAASDIVSIISDYVPLRKKGKNFWGCCPFHHEKTPSFSVTPDKGFFYCFGCQTGGNVFNFLMKIENVSFYDAVKLLARKLNIPLPEKEKSEQERLRERQLARLYQVNQLARDFFHACLTKTNYGKMAREYLLNRGVTADTVEKFKLGFAPPAWDKLSTAFMERGVDAATLVKAGLAVKRPSGNGIYDRFRDRIMFPICDARGRVVGFGGRVLDASQPKYLNTAETLIFNKRHILFAFDHAVKAIRESGQAIVVEGYMDAIAAHAAGVQNVVASLGTAFTPEQAKLLMRLTSEFIFAYDSDAAGQSATLRALGTVRSLGASVRVLSIPDGKDPDEFIRKHGANAFRELSGASLGLLDYQIKQVVENSDYTTLEGKVQVVNKLLPALAQAENAIEVNAQVAYLSQLLSIDESAIRSELRKYLSYLKKDKNVKTGNNIVKNVNPVHLSRQPVPATVAAERHLIRLMCEDTALIPYVKVQVDANDFADDKRQKIVSMLFTAHDKGENLEPSALAVALDEASNAEFSHIMLIDMPCVDVAKMVDDCLKTIRLAHLQKLYEQHRLQADELERVGDSRFLQELAESQRIKNEISKLHQS